MAKRGGSTSRHRSVRADLRQQVPTASRSG